MGEINSPNQLTDSELDSAPTVWICLVQDTGNACLSMRDGKMHSCHILTCMDIPNVSPWLIAASRLPNQHLLNGMNASEVVSITGSGLRRVIVHEEELGIRLNDVLRVSIVPNSSSIPRRVC